MTKYAVDTSPPRGQTKTASEGARCKICGAVGERVGDVLLCKTHGSEGFEQRLARTWHN